VHCPVFDCDKELVGKKAEVVVTLTALIANKPGFLDTDVVVSPSPADAEMAVEEENNNNAASPMDDTEEENNDAAASPMEVEADDTAVRGSAASALTLSISRT